MNKINNFFVFIALVLAFVSCSEVEPLDPVLANQVNSGNNNGSGSGSNGGGNTGGTSSGDYWPAAINNEWIYDSNGSSSTMKIIATETINGQLYYKFAPQNGSGASSSGVVTTSMTKASGVYKLKTHDFTIDAGGGLTGTQTGFEFIVLKDNIPVNGTWTGSYTQTTTYTGIPPITLTVNYVATILAKGVSESIDNEVFTNIIKVKIDQTSSFPGAPSTTISSEYWFAKDVGIIKSTTIGGGANSSSYLVDYTLF
ncbi:conserved exported hypothetical protein [Flavobacterium sp. 9AF]|uniref:hypothetical protein n=1 Tax=Flavobacterium sp. 9AF TaxID=2653142 RepID=UPI0012F3ED15|nr:hypothetical protein [Flavobacterium sp. 9AF]VXA96276.1 conserved exported hypothetical protein [Flavobacterium sp. 9AF]